jgi:hypothetical protein
MWLRGDDFHDCPRQDGCRRKSKVAKAELFSPTSPLDRQSRPTWLKCAACKFLQAAQSIASRLTTLQESIRVELSSATIEKGSLHPPQLKRVYTIWATLRPEPRGCARGMNSTLGLRWALPTPHPAAEKGAEAALRKEVIGTAQCKIDLSQPSSSVLPTLSFF